MILDLNPGTILLDIKNKCIYEVIDDDRIAKHVLTEELIVALSPLELNLNFSKAGIKYLKKILKGNGPRASIIVEAGGPLV